MGRCRGSLPDASRSTAERGSACVGDPACAARSCAAESRRGPRIAFVRHTWDDALIREIPFDSVERLFEELSSGETTRRAEAARTPVAAGLITRARRWMIYSIQRMPPEISNPLLQAAVLQVAAIRHAKTLLTGSALPTQHRHRAETSATAPSSVRLAAQSGEHFSDPGSRMDATAIWFVAAAGTRAISAGTLGLAVQRPDSIAATGVVRCGVGGEFHSLADSNSAAMPQTIRDQPCYRDRCRDVCA